MASINGGFGVRKFPSLTAHFRIALVSRGGGARTALAARRFPKSSRPWLWGYALNLSTKDELQESDGHCFERVRPNYGLRRAAGTVNAERLGHFASYSVPEAAVDTVCP